MIITCKCGKYEFEVTKNEIPKEGRDVQCGVCNETWFQTPYERKVKSTSSTTSFGFLRTLFYIVLIVLTVAGVMDMLKDYFIPNFPETINYYLFSQNIIEQIKNGISDLFILLGIRY